MIFFQKLLNWKQAQLKVNKWNKTYMRKGEKRKAKKKNTTLKMSVDFCVSQSNESSGSQ